MLLILSARPVGEDIALQYGRMPPAFLPLGSRRLFAWQAEQAAGGPVAMTLPEAFEAAATDRDALAAAGIRVLRQPPGLSLTQAIAAAVEAARPEGPIRLLYGDTLARLPEAAAPGGDWIAVQRTTANYPWAFVLEDEEGGLQFSDEPPERLDTRRVICGDYGFSDPGLLVRACAASATLVEALAAYHAERPLAPVEAEAWFDFGHLPLYLQSKQRIMVARAFNDLAYERHSLVKRSTDTAKMRAEAHWYESLPPALLRHVPRYHGRVERDHRAGYAVEYLYHPLLGDLAAFGRLPLPSWLEILAACLDFVDECRAIRPPEGAPEASAGFARGFFDGLLVDKTWDRLGRHLAATGGSLEDRYTLDGRALPPLRDLVAGAIARIPPTAPDDVRFWHGDLFYGNLFYDFTARRVLAIDPRGQDGSGQLCLWGDWRYDVAKLAHSVIGQYDRIILGRARLEAAGPRDWRLTLSEEPHQERIGDIFLGQVEARYGLGREALTALTALLFFSMLPLHAERPDLQRMMLAQAMRLASRPEAA